MEKMATIEQDVFLEWLKDRFMKSPSEEDYIAAENSVRERVDASFQADNIRLHVSPNRAILREKAFAAMRRQAVKMMKQTANKRAIPIMDNCVQVPLKWMDQSRFDGNYVLGVVVEVTTGFFLRIATKAGVLKDCFSPSHVNRLDGVSNNRVINGLDGVFREWEGIPRVTVQKAARFVSKSGGQGYSRCGCQVGKCDSKRCKCFRTTVKCTSKCKCNVNKCCNREQQVLLDSSNLV